MSDPTGPTAPDSVTGDPEEVDGLGRRQAREATLVEEPEPEQTLTRRQKRLARDQARPPKSPTRNALEWVGVVGGAVIIAVVVRTFVFQTFWIPSPSMSPTLVRNDRVLVNKLSYKFHDVNRGDVVVFKRPPNEPAGTVKDLIKRVVGLSGERVSILDGKVRIDGEALTEPYTHGLQTIYDSSCSSVPLTGLDTETGFTVPAGHLFVMGDNRVNSHDGRCFGPVNEDLLVGRAFFILWPPSKAGGL